MSLEAGVQADRTRSDLERYFLQLCRRHGLPRPRVNVRIDRWEVDFLWPDTRVVVETDCYIYHRGRLAFENDHVRDAALRRRGFDVIRLSERQLEDEPDDVLAVVRDTLAAAGSRLAAPGGSE